MPRTIGRVVNVTAKGELLIDMATDNDPRRVMGGFLVDARHAPIARIRDVIGPASSPVVVASPRREHEPHRLVGRELYLAPPRKGGRPGQHRGGRPPGPPRQGGRFQDRGGSSRGGGRSQGHPGRGGESRRRGGGAR